MTLPRHKSSCFQQVEGSQTLAAALQEKNAPQVIAQDPNHFWTEITVLPGLHGYHKDRTADSLSPQCRISVRVPHRHPFSEVLIHPAALAAILVMGVWCA